MSNGISRRHFFFGTLLAGVIPRGGFGSVVSLKALGYQSPNEKMNIAGVGAGGRAGERDRRSGIREHRRAGRRRLGARRRGVQALGEGDAVQGLPPDARQGEEHRRGDGRHPRSHACDGGAGGDAARQARLRREAADANAWEARLLTDAAAKYKVATQMGNQGYSHEATRVAAEILWSGEIGDVTEVHSFRGRAGWPQGMQTLPAPEKVPDTLDWDLWLGGAAFRPYTSGDEAYRKEYNQDQYGFYLPFNWRGFYDFGTSLIGDWGIHQLGPANLALRLGAPTSVECIKQGEGRSPYTFPRGGVAIKWEFAARDNMPPVTIYWSDTGDMYTPPGMTVEQMRQISGTGSGDRRRRRRWWSRARRSRRTSLRARRSRSRRSRPRPWKGRCRRRRRRPGTAGQRLQHRVRGIEGVSRHQRSRRRRRIDPRNALGGISTAAAPADAIARTSTRLDSRLQRRRTRVLELQRRRPLHGVDGSRRDRRRGSKASCCGTPGRWSSRITRKRTNT